MVERGQGDGSGGRGFSLTGWTLSSSPIENTEGWADGEVYLVLDTVLVQTGIPHHRVPVHDPVRRQLLQGLEHHLRRAELPGLHGPVDLPPLGFLHKGDVIRAG